MTRLPRRGVTLASVPRGREVLEEILHNLKVEHAIELNLTDTDKQQIRHRICLINGNFLQTTDPFKASSIAKPIIESIQSSLDTIITGLSRPEQESIQDDGLEAAFRIANALESHKANAHSSPLNDGRIVASSPLDDERIVSLLSLSRVVKDACERALAELNSVRGRSGRPPLGWYDEFVQLLLEFAHIAAIDPVVKTDRISGERTGPFIELALAFEQLLLLYEHPAGHSMSMRSPSRDACAKRLERSRSRLRGR